MEQALHCADRLCRLALLVDSYIEVGHPLTSAFQAELVRAWVDFGVALKGDPEALQLAEEALPGVTIYGAQTTFERACEYYFFFAPLPPAVELN